MTTFAKLFEIDPYGQILIKQDSDDEGRPELRAYVSPAGLRVCSAALRWEGSEAGWALADKAFADADARFAERMAKSIFELAGNPT